MKILVINPVLYTSNNGVIPQVKTIKDTMIYSMCLGLKKTGNDVTLLAIDDYMPTQPEAYDVDVLWFKANLKRVLKDALPLSVAMLKWIRKNHCRYDMILASETFMFHSLLCGIVCPEKTLIWQELNVHQRKFHQLPSKFWHKVIVPLFMRRIKVVVGRSASARDFIGQYMPHTVATIVDHGIDIEKFECSTVKKRQVISSSQLIFRKNVDGIIKKFAQFHHYKGYEDIKLLIAGRGDEEEKLKDLAHALGLTDYVQFLGFLPQQELNRYIKDSYCFLINTRRDLNMVSIPESIVSGTPVVTNMVPALSGEINRLQLGIAKDNWGADELKHVIDNNHTYVKNCVRYRQQMSAEHQARSLTACFNGNELQQGQAETK